jgi:hypothetical protein
MKDGFQPIKLNDYVERFLKSNPTERRTDVIKRLRDAIDAFSRDKRCRCGEQIWVIGSAEVGHACFTCITGESTPDNDYEIDVACR